MKLKIIALPVLQTAFTLCVEPVPLKPFYNTNCFAWSFLGIMDPSPDWHQLPVSKLKKSAVHRVASCNLNDLPGEKEVVFEWQQGHAEKPLVFQSIFRDIDANGYLVFVNFSNKTLGHVLALKHRAGYWRFMDPTVVKIKSNTGYLHAQLNEWGQMRLAGARDVSVLDYLFEAYPTIVKIGVIVVT